MKTDLLAQVTIRIDAPVAQVWKAITDPALVKQYFFGTELVSDWKINGPIVFRGTWEGKPYEDKGIIKALEPNKLLHFTYWSNLSGAPDTPDNYANITYKLSAEGEQTVLTVTQDHIDSDERKAESVKNWNTVLEGLKNLLEK